MLSRQIRAHISLSLGDRCGSHLWGYRCGPNPGGQVRLPSLGVQVRPHSEYVAPGGTGAAPLPWGRARPPHVPLGRVWERPPMAETNEHEHVVLRAPGTTQEPMEPPRTNRRTQGTYGNPQGTIFWPRNLQRTQELSQPQEQVAGNPHGFPAT